MLDLRHLVRNADDVCEALRWRGVDAESVKRVHGLARQRLELQQQLEALQALVNRRSHTQHTNASAFETKVERRRLRKEREHTDKELASELHRFPNLPHASSPLGTTERDDVIVRERPSDGAVGEVVISAVPPSLGSDVAARVAGSGFELLKGRDARILRALVTFAMELHSPEFVELLLPSLASDESMFGSGHLPKFSNAAYRVPADGLWLAPTAEVAFCALHRGDRLAAENLPARYVAHLTCFRREAGGGGASSRFRLHQYHQVELFSVCEPSRSIGELEYMLEKSELALQLLGLRYRVIEMCRSQLPFSAAKAYRLEIFLPRSGCWMDVSTVSLATDFQGRRSDIQLAGCKARNYAHTVNASALACSRVRIALLEYGYSGDSGLTPSALAPYL